MTSVDEIHPTLSDLLSSLMMFKTVDNGSQAVLRIQKWDNKIKGLEASYQLTEEEARDFRYDVARSYDEIKKQLEL